MSLQLDADVLARLKTLAQQVAEREGCQLYDVEFVGGSRGQGRVVRVYLDKAPDGVSITDCSNVSHGLNLLLDVEDIIPGGAYTLEVSSPGMDRLLREPWHFTSVLGKKIWLRTSSSMEAERVRKQATGTLSEASEEGIVVDVDHMHLRIPYAIIERARVVVSWEENKGKKK